jgi:hypothetical protein
MSIDYDIVPIEEVIRADQANHGHFFNEGAKRFFNSRSPQVAYKQKGYYFWVTSEKNGSENPRLYTIRFACCNCMSIHDIDGFQAHKSMAAATARLKYVLKTWDAKELVAYHHWKMDLKHIPCASEKTGGV